MFRLSVADHICPRRRFHWSRPRHYWGRVTCRHRSVSPAAWMSGCRLRRQQVSYRSDCRTDVVGVWLCRLVVDLLFVVRTVTNVSPRQVDARQCRVVSGPSDTSTRLHLARRDIWTTSEHLFVDLHILITIQ